MPSAARSAALAAATALLAGAACAWTPVDVRRDVSYDDRYGASTTMDLYLPEDEATGRPALLAVHGGGWTGGSKELEAGLCRRFAHSGFVCATINYRLSGEAVFPAALQDTKCALVFLRANAAEYGIDPDRIVVTGYSAGGHLSALLASTFDFAELEPDCDVAVTSGERAYVAAAMPGAGPTDLRPLDFAPAVTDFLGGTAEDLPDVYALASPIEHARAGLVPYLFVQGSADWFVPANQSREMHDALLAAGSASRLIVMTGASHLFQPGAEPNFFMGPAGATTTNEAWIAMMDFLDDTVGAP